MSPILDRIYGLMAERRMNAKYVSETLHLSNSSFTDWKKGKGNPNVEALTKMAEFFDVSLDYLILGKETVPIPATADTPLGGSATLAFSNRADRDLYDKFHRLPAAYQGKVMAYLDGMLAALPDPVEEEPVPVPETGRAAETPDSFSDVPELSPVAGQDDPDGEERKSA